MLSFPNFADQPLWYAGLVWALAMGWAASSYASNFAWRLPRGETPFGREPYCGECNAKLTPRDLFPIFSWLLSGGKCRHCGAKVPASYFFLELLYVPYVGLCYAAFGFGDMFLLIAFLGMLLQIAAMMAWDDDYISPVLNLLLICTGLMFQLMRGNFLMDGLLGIFFALFAALILRGFKTGEPPKKDVYALPKWVWLIAASGAWLNSQTMLVFGIAWLAVYALLSVLKIRSDVARIAVAQAAALLLAVWWGLLV